MWNSIIFECKRTVSIPVPHSNMDHEKLQENSIYILININFFERYLLLKVPLYMELLQDFNAPSEIQRTSDYIWYYAIGKIGIQGDFQRNTPGPASIDIEKSNNMEILKTWQDENDL